MKGTGGKKWRELPLARRVGLGSVNDFILISLKLKQSLVKSHLPLIL